MRLKKSLKKWIRNADQRYLGGRLKRAVRRAPVSSGSSSQMAPEDKLLARQELMRQIQLSLPTDREVKRVEIIVLKYKEPKIEAECARYIIENTEWPYKLNFFDNRPGTKNMSKIWNQLVRGSTCDYVVIMDSDVFVPKIEPCWLTRCMATFEKYPDCYVVSPMVTRTSGFQQQADVSRNAPPEKMTEIFAGMCLLFKKDVFDKIGWFDEEFLLFGTDTEWSWRLINSRECAGYLRPDVVVDHVWHASTGKAAKDEISDYNFQIEKEYSNERLKEKNISNAPIE